MLESQQQALSIDSISVVQTIACYGDSDGSARMFVSGGMPNYTYMWDSGETGLIAQNLSSGYRHVSLTDDWGCTVMDSVYISENPEIQPTVSLGTDSKLLWFVRWYCYC